MAKWFKNLFCKPMPLETKTPPTPVLSHKPIQLTKEQYENLLKETPADPDPKKFKTMYETINELSKWLDENTNTLNYAFTVCISALARRSHIYRESEEEFVQRCKELYHLNKPMTKSQNDNQGDRL